MLILIALGGFLIFGLLFQLLERFGAPHRTAGVREARFKWGLLAAGVCLGVTLLTMTWTPISWGLSTLAVAPLLITALNCCLGRQRWPFLSSFLLLLGGLGLAMAVSQFFVFVFSILMLVFALSWWLTIPLVLFLPCDPAYPDAPDIRAQKGLRYISYPVCGFVLLWISLSQWIYLQSVRLAAPAPNCIMETDGQKSRWSLSLSPAKMFLRNGDEWITLPYLRATDSNGSFHNHWSFVYMAFVPDENLAFDSGPSYYSRDQARDPCE